MRTVRTMGTVAVLLAAVSACGGGAASGRSTPAAAAATVSPTGVGAADCATVRARWNQALEAGLTPPAKGPAAVTENTTRSLEAASKIMNAHPACFSDWDFEALQQTLEYGKKVGATMPSRWPTPSP